MLPRPVTVTGSQKMRNTNASSAATTPMTDKPPLRYTRNAKAKTTKAQTVDASKTIGAHSTQRGGTFGSKCGMSRNSNQYTTTGNQPMTDAATKATDCDSRFKGLTIKLTGARPRAVGRKRTRARASG